tara:strand:+ start:5853 stop:6278 length:426 start_codon:yes stop_codon:yes gene_type:complete
MTFTEIVDLGVKNGFIINKEKKYPFLTLNRKDGIKVELSFPGENVVSDLGEGVNINWEYKLFDTKTGVELYKDWLDIYGGTAQDKIMRIKNEVIEFINKISTSEIRIKEKFAFSFFGFKFLKYKELEFKTENNLWSEIING